MDFGYKKRKHKHTRFYDFLNAREILCSIIIANKRLAACCKAHENECPNIHQLYRNAHTYHCVFTVWFGEVITNNQRPICGSIILFAETAGDIGSGACAYDCSL